MYVWLRYWEIATRIAHEFNFTIHDNRRTFYTVNQPIDKLQSIVGRSADSNSDRDNVKHAKFFLVLIFLANHGSQSVQSIAEFVYAKRPAGPNRDRAIYRLTHRFLVGDRTKKTRGMVDRGILNIDSSDSSKLSFSLNVFGVLLSILFFTRAADWRKTTDYEKKYNSKKHFDFSYEKDWDIEILDVLAQHYDKTLPLIFGHWDFLKESKYFSAASLLTLAIPTHNLYYKMEQSSFTSPPDPFGSSPLGLSLYQIYGAFFRTAFHGFGESSSKQRINALRDHIPDDILDFMVSNTHELIISHGMSFFSACFPFTLLSDSKLLDDLKSNDFFSLLFGLEKLYNMNDDSFYTFPLPHRPDFFYESDFMSFHYDMSDFDKWNNRNLLGQFNLDFVGEFLKDFHKVVDPDKKKSTKKSVK